MTHGRYILVGHEPKPEPDLLKWAQWFETADRHVADTRHELFRVSTVFLGLDHRHSGKGPPILFETMVFLRDGGPHDDDDAHITPGAILSRAEESIECARYAAWDDAEIGHKAMVRRMLERAAASAYMPPIPSVYASNTRIEPEAQCSPTKTNAKPSKRSPRSST